MRLRSSAASPFRVMVGATVLGLLSVTASMAQEEADAITAAMDSTVTVKGMEVLAIQVAHLQGKSRIDGVLDEPFWKHTGHYTIERESYPALFAPSPVRTDVYFARVNDAVMLGFKAYDPRPEEIQAPLRDRDGIDRDDYVGVSFDLAGKLLTTHEFYVSASGVQADWVRNRVADVRSKDWDANWHSAARIDEDGYTVEMRIPLEELEIPLGLKDLKRLVVFKRHYPRDVRHHLGRVAIIKPIKNPLLPDQKVNVIPAITFLHDWSRDAVKDTDWETEDDTALSLDLEYKLTPSLVLLGALNPNYLEVEADLTETSINNPFSKLEPEKRPFFTRGTETFDTLYDLVYTRNIEDTRAGLKLVGSLGNVTMGNFIVDDRDLRLIVPGNLSSKTKTLELESVSGTMRHRYDIARGLSAGTIVTARSGDSDYHNVVGGADMYAKLGRYDEFRAQWVASDSQYPEELVDELDEGVDDDYDPEDDVGIPGETRFNERVLRADPTQSFSDDALWVKYKHNRRSGYVMAQYRDVGRDFRSDLGYMPRVDYRTGLVGAGLDRYVEYRDKGQMRFRLSGTLLRQETQAGELLMESRDVWLNYWGLLQSWVRIGYRNRDRVAKRYVQNTLAVEDNAPMFNEQQIEWRIESSPQRNGRLVLAGKFGDQIDTDNYRLGDIIEIKPSFALGVGNRFEISIEDAYRQLHVDGGRLFTENYLRLNLTYQFGRGSFVRLTLIDDWIKRDPDLYLYEEEDREEQDTSAEILFAWKPSQRNAFLLGIKADAIDGDELENPRLEDARVYVKYARAFRL